MSSSPKDSSCEKVAPAGGLYTVFMTRETDIFIPLPERVNISRAHSADLFISLHADSNPDSSVNGASIYTLSVSGSDREAAALARKENQSDIIAGVDLSGENSPVASILVALAPSRDTMNRSSRFAEMAVTELSRATDIFAARTPSLGGFCRSQGPRCAGGPDRAWFLPVQFP